jgi:hypothetical protein
MPEVLGLITKKRNAATNFTCVNRYWILATGLTNGLDIGQDVLGVEMSIFGDTVNGVSVHVWRPNTLPHEKLTRFTDIPGTQTGFNKIKPQITARMFFSPLEDSNPYYKDYRVQVDNDNLNGTEWLGTYQTDLQAMLDNMDGLGAIFCTKAGEVINVGSFSTEYEFRQLSKRWYNRTV